MAALPRRLSDIPINLASMPAPTAVETINIQNLLANWLLTFTALDPKYTVLLESDPAIMVNEVGSYREQILRQRINDALKALMLPFSYGSNLDALGSWFGVYRIVLQAADPTTFPPTPLIMEQDGPFANRIAWGTDAWAAAGPMGAYQYQARTADANIVDVAVYNYGIVPSLNPGDVMVVVLTNTDANLSVAVQNVYTRLHRADIQPLTDNVLVRAANPVSWSLDATLHVGRGADPATIQAAALSAFTAFLTARRKVGQLMPISGIYSALTVSGTCYVELSSPLADIPVNPLSYADIDSTSISVVTDA